MTPIGLNSYQGAGARGYDISRCADTALCDALAAALPLSPDGQYLDVGCGTGNYTIALAAKGGAWTGLDPARDMLAEARKKAAALSWVEGRAEALPFENGCIDGIISVLALHHMADLSAAFHEAARVLQVTGRLAIFTATPEQAQACWLRAYFPDMIARDADILPSLSAMDAAADAAGLVRQAIVAFHITETTQDRFFYSGKLRPEIYLDAHIRANMSPFRHIEDAELTRGLAALKTDIDSCKVAGKIAAADNDDGDYCIVSYAKASRVGSIGIDPYG